MSVLRHRILVLFLEAPRVFGKQTFKGKPVALCDVLGVALAVGGTAGNFVGALAVLLYSCHQIVDFRAALGVGVELVGSLRKLVQVGCKNAATAKGGECLQ